jgi:hypothetical protein
MAPEYRRCGIYLIVGYFVLGGASLSVKLEGLDRDWESSVSRALLLAPFMLAPALLTFRQVLRVDGNGIWRRRFFRWDLWNWDAFAGGQIRAGSSSTRFIYPSKPWWNRNMCLEYLQRDDRESVLKLIRLHWKPPAPPKLPDNIAITLPFRRRAHLSPEGLRICKSKRDPCQAYSWAEIQRLEVERLDHARRDFVSLDISLPDKTLRLLIQKGAPNWNGVDAETLLRYVQEYVPSDRQKIRALNGAPLNMDEANSRLAELERKCRQVRWLGRVIPIALIACCLLAVNIVVRRHGQNPLRWDWWAWFGLGIMLFMVSIMGAVMLAVVSQILNDLKERTEEVVDWLQH